MFKAIILLKRKDDMSHEDFTAWWIGEHKPLAATLPNARKVIFNLADDETADEFDGVSELWFDSREDFDAAYATDIGKAVAADSMSNVGARVRMFVMENSVVPAEG